MINKLIQDKIMRYVHAHFGFDIPMQAGMLFLVSCVTTFVLLWLFVRFSKNIFSHSARPHTPDGHKVKQDTPTMGGICILLGSIVPLLLLSNKVDAKIWLCVGSLVSFGLIGLCDDLCKQMYKKGISALGKFFLQLCAGGTLAWLMVVKNGFVHTLWIPFLSNATLQLDSTMTIAWITFLFVACANAVNLTDGLDGLAVECLIPNFCAALFLIVVSANGVFADYLGLVPYDIGILVLPIAAILGSLYAFLWFNTYPALIFMGDVGSLALGSALAYLFLETQYEFLLLISGIFFVFETVSVIIQVLVFKITKKRIFKMAPYHHHLELTGMHEARIVKRCSMLSWSMFVLVIVAFLGHCFYIK